MRTKMESYCKHCNTCFKSASALEKHKKRSTGCISWKDMDEKFQDYENRMASLVENLKRSLELVKEKSESYEQVILKKDNKIRELAEQVLMMEKKPKWEEVMIVAPFMAQGTKKTLKQVVKDMSETDEIKSYIQKNYPDLRIVRILDKKKSVEITLEDPELSECKICFMNKAQKKGRCKTCKTCYTCAECEYDQFVKHKRCAFCNTGF